MPENPMYIITLTWDASTGRPRLTIGDGFNIFDAYALLAAAMEDLWECRPYVSLAFEGPDGTIIEEIEDVDDDE